MEYYYEFSPSISTHNKYKIKKLGLEKALKNGTWKDYLPNSDEKPHDGNKWLDNKYGIFHFHLITKQERKSKENPTGKESDEIVIYIKLYENFVYIVGIYNHTLFRGKGLKNILSIIEREKPCYLGNNPNYKFYINQDSQSTTMDFLGADKVFEFLGLKYSPNKKLEFESAVLYILTEGLENFNIYYAIKLTHQPSKEVLERLTEAVYGFDISYKIKKSLIPEYNIWILKEKFKGITFKNNIDLYKQIIEMEINDEDYRPFYKLEAQKYAPVILKSKRTSSNYTDEDLFALMQSPKTTFDSLIDKSLPQINIKL